MTSENDEVDVRQMGISETWAYMFKKCYLPELELGCDEILGWLLAEGAEDMDGIKL